MAVQAAGWDAHVATRDHRQELDMTGMDMSPPMVGSWVPVKTQALMEDSREGAGDDTDVTPASLSLGGGATFFPPDQGGGSNYAEPPTGPGSPRSRSALPARTTTMWAPSSWAPGLASEQRSGDASNAGDSAPPVTGLLGGDRGPPRGESMEDASGTAHQREGRSASPAPVGDRTANDQSASEAQALYSIGEHVLYWSDTHKQWMDAKVTRQNFDARGNLLTYDLDVKRGAQAAKIRRLPPPGEPWPQPPNAQAPPKATAGNSASQKAPTPVGHSIAAAPAGDEMVPIKETPPVVAGPGSSGPPPQAINKEDQRLLPRFEEGERVAYWSDTYEQWMQATVERIRDDGVTYDLDVKRGAQRRKMKPLRWNDPQTVPAAVAVQMRTMKVQAQNDPRAQTRGPSPLSGRARGLSCEPADRAESVAPLQVDLGAARPVQSGDSGGYPRIGSQVLVANDSHLPAEYTGSQSFPLEGNVLPTASSLVSRPRVQQNNVVASNKPKNDFGRPVYNGTGPVYGNTGVPPKAETNDGRRIPPEVGPTIGTRPQTDNLSMRPPAVGSTPQMSRVVGQMTGPGASPTTSVGLPGASGVRVFTEMQTASAVASHSGTHVNIGGASQAGGSEGAGGISPKKVQVTIMPNGQVTSTAADRMMKSQQQETVTTPTSAATAGGRPSLSEAKAAAGGRISLSEAKADEGSGVGENSYYMGSPGLDKRTSQEIATLAHLLGVDRGPGSVTDSELAGRVAAALARLPLREIRRQLSEAHVDTSLCKEKQELEALLAETLIRQPPASATAGVGGPVTTTLRAAPSPSPSPSPAPAQVPLAGTAPASVPLAGPGQTAGPHRVDPAVASGHSVASGGIKVGELDIGAGAFDPTQPSLRAQLIARMGTSENSSVEEMTGFRGGLNEGVWFLSDVTQGVAEPGARKQEFVLKLVRCYRIAPKVLTEAENFLKMASSHPAIVADASVAFPVWIFGCLGPDKNKRYDLIVMWKARGERLAEVIAHKWYMKQFDTLWCIFEKLGANLGSFHRRYGNTQHGDFQPSNIFYDEKEDRFSLIDVGGMGVLTMENDLEHFAKALKLLADAYGPQLISEGLRAFEAGHARAMTAR